MRCECKISCDLIGLEANVSSMTSHITSLLTSWPGRFVHAPSSRFFSFVKGTMNVLPLALMKQMMDQRIISPAYVRMLREPKRTRT